MQLPFCRRSPSRVSTEDCDRESTVSADSWSAFYSELVAVTEGVLSQVPDTAEHRCSEMRLLEELLDGSGGAARTGW